MRYIAIFTTAAIALLVCGCALKTTTIKSVTLGEEYTITTVDNFFTRDVYTEQQRPYCAG